MRYAKHSKHLQIALALFVVVAIYPGISLAATKATKKVAGKSAMSVRVTSNNCAASLEQLRVMGLHAMQARRDAALLKATSPDAKQKANDAYAAEMNVAAKQLEAAKALCTTPTAKPGKILMIPAAGHVRVNSGTIYPTH